MGREPRTLTCPPDVAALVPESLALEHAFFPLRALKGALKIAVAAPLSEEAKEIVRFVLAQEIREALYPAEVIRRSLDELYGVPVEQDESIFYLDERPVADVASALGRPVGTVTKPLSRAIERLKALTKGVTR